MLSVRVIPSLLIKGSGLYKGRSFAEHRYVGDPVNAVKIFNDKEVDELVFQDITATIEGREPNYELIEDMASQAFMPLSYGGGIKSTAQIEKIFKCGIEKVILNTSAINDLSLVKEASRIAGSQSIVLAIDVKKSFFGKYSVYTHAGTKKTDYDPVELSLKAQEYGAGEIILCSIDREGSLHGYDLNLIEKVASQLSIPLVASGGASSMNDFKQAVAAGASAVSAGSMFVFHGKHKAVLITYPSYEQLEEHLRG